MAITGRHIGPDVMQALKLPKGTRSVEIMIAHDEVVTAKVEYMVQEPEARAFVKMLAKYRLELIEEKPANALETQE
jgi:hypothetical protein